MFSYFPFYSLPHTVPLAVVLVIVVVNMENLEYLGVVIPVRGSVAGHTELRVYCAAERERMANGALKVVEKMVC